MKNTYCSYSGKENYKAGDLVKHNDEIYLVYCEGHGVCVHSPNILKVGGVVHGIVFGELFHGTVTLEN